MFEKVLIANRGEVALRIHRACREMGIRTVAVHSEADADAMHVRLADEAVCIGPARSTDSYLNMSAIISAAHITGADAIHPGFGFLSESADFAEMVEEHGITFIGPRPEIMRMMGDKITAREASIKAGLPVVPGSPALESVEHAIEWAHKIGYPVIVKAKDGGGGKGMKTAFNDEEMKEAYTMAKAEAKNAFTSDVVYMEKYLQKPRHIEMQVLADNYGHVVHLGERDCSIQRNHQKVIEETPSPALNQKQREEIGEIARHAAEVLGYNNAGTMETARKVTEDGLERTVSVNYVGPYLLTRKLLPLMGEGSRIVNMVSCTYAIGTLDFPDFFRKGKKGGFWRIPIYSNTKLALTLFTIDLSRRVRERGITVNAADPGIVSTDIITMHMWFDPLTDILFRPFIRTPRQGAATAISLLLDEETGKRTGTLNVSCHPKHLSDKYLHHRQMAELWERTEQEVKKWL